MNTNYKILGKFKAYGIIMVIVKLPCGTHVMSENEWNRICNSLYYPRKHKNNVRRHKIA